METMELKRQFAENESFTTIATVNIEKEKIISVTDEFTCKTVEVGKIYQLVDILDLDEPIPDKNDIENGSFVFLQAEGVLEYNGEFLGNTMIGFNIVFNVEEKSDDTIRCIVRITGIEEL